MQKFDMIIVRYLLRSKYLQTMAWSQIYIIYGVAISIADLIKLFPNLDWPDANDEDICYGVECAELLSNYIESEVPDYTYDCQYSRRNRWTGKMSKLSQASDCWVHTYPCCAELADTHLLIGRIVGDVEPEQFLDMTGDKSLAIWNSVLTFSELLEMKEVNVTNRNSTLTPELEKEVQATLKAIGFEQQMELYMSADDCYSCT